MPSPNILANFSTDPFTFGLVGYLTYAWRGDAIKGARPYDDVVVLVSERTVSITV